MQLEEAIATEKADKVLISDLIGAFFAETRAVSAQWRR